MFDGGVSNLVTSPGRLINTCSAALPVRGGGGGREPNAARMHSPVTRAKFVHVSGLYCGQCLCLSDGNLRINVAVILIAGVERASRLFCLEMCQSGRSACVRHPAIRRRGRVVAVVRGYSCKWGQGHSL